MSKISETATEYTIDHWLCGFKFTLRNDNDFWDNPIIGAMASFCKDYDKSGVWNPEDWLEVDAYQNDIRQEGAYEYKYTCP